MYKDYPVQIISVSDVIGAPWNPVTSPKLRGYKWAVVQNIRDYRGIWDNRVEHFNCYGGLFAILALCTTPEAAEAARRLLSL